MSEQSKCKWTSLQDRDEGSLSLDDLLRLIDNGQVSRKAFFSFELDVLYDGGYAHLVEGKFVRLTFKGLKELPNAQRRYHVNKRNP